jgi:hypothetical protein
VSPSNRAASAPAPASLSGPRIRPDFNDEADACGDDEEPSSAVVSAASGESASVPLTISASVLGRSSVAGGLVAEGLVTSGASSSTVVGSMVTSIEVATGSLEATGFVAARADGSGAMVLPSSTSVMDGRFLRVVLGSAFPV